MSVTLLAFGCARYVTDEPERHGPAGGGCIVDWCGCSGLSSLCFDGGSACKVPRGGSSG